MRRRPGAVVQLDDGDAVLVVDETADEKSSADAVGAARQYSGTVGGIALCQVAVTLTFATSHGHTLIDRGAVPAPGMRSRRRAPGAGRGCPRR
jgi:SRSO17 transposase